MRTVLEQSFWDRLGGVITLKRPTYEAIAPDSAASGQAWWIVVLLGLANGIALIVTPISTLFPATPADGSPDAASVVAAFTFDTTGERLLALAVGVIGAILSWYLSSWLLRAIGVRMSAKWGQDISPEQMRRLVAWGYSPTLASFFSLIPVLGPSLATLGSIWAFVTGVLAVRVAFDVGIGKAIAIEIIAFLLILLLAIVLVTIAITIAVALSP